MSETLYVSTPPQNPGEEPHRHNHRLKLERLKAEGKLTAKPGEVNDIGVAHDDSCRIFSGGFCNCDPDIYLNGKLVQ